MPKPVEPMEPGYFKTLSAAIKKDSAAVEQALKDYETAVDLAADGLKKRIDDI